MNNNHFLKINLKNFYKILISFNLISKIHTFLACNCFGHSDECEYDPEVDEKHLSLDIHDNYEGGGVCKNCRDNTEGINCNRCKSTFYRPDDKPLNATDVCQRKSLFR